MLIRLLWCICLCFPWYSWAWNATGHRLIALIAYQQLTPQAKVHVQHLMRERSRRVSQADWANLAVWLDRQRCTSTFRPCYRKYHYIDIPYSVDGTPPKALASENAVWAIQHSMQAFPSASEAQKRLYLKILLHVVGDIHQPMHAISYYSKRFPEGDQGGNLWYLGTNTVANNLHAYWDQGSGWLQSGALQRIKVLKRTAKRISKKWPCVKGPMDPARWANESHHIAQEFAYMVPPFVVPSAAYRQQVRLITERRIALAGCRLGQVLNQVL
ncbi:MAG: S1/P1 nuclease [Legionellaceae bacterium]|nr:S1/P1 nuclease [Legionellaceae bacterium]